VLSSSDVQQLREKVQAAQQGPFQGEYQWARCIDGPLIGLHVKIGLDVCRQPDATFGWCQLSEKGPVVACYTQTGTAGEWRFRGFDLPGRRESGSVA